MPKSKRYNVQTDQAAEQCQRLKALLSPGRSIGACKRSALDSIHQNHLGREELRWNDGQLMTCYTR